MSHYILLTVEIGEALTEGDKTTTNHNATPETLTYGIGNIIIMLPLIDLWYNATPD